MKSIKKCLCLVLSLVMVLSCFVFAPETALNTKAANDATADGRLHLNSSGNFKILQLADLHDFVGFADNKIATIRKAIKDTAPDLIVLTGDNFTGDNTRSSIYGGTGSDSKNNIYFLTVKELVDEFHDEAGNKIPFAVTFGNHDAEATSDIGNYNTDEERYKLSVELGGVDYDNPAISDWGTGTIPVYGKVGTSAENTVVDKIIIVNSGNIVGSEKSKYARPGANEDGTDNEARYLQICNYIDKEIAADSSIPVIAFQHIPLQEFYLSGILTAGGSIGSQTTANSAISGNYQKASGVQGNYNEKACCSYYSTEELYKAYAKSNTIGVFYGHDHSNTVYGSGTCYGKTLVQGYGSGLTGGTPSMSTYTINPGSTAFTRTLTQSSSYTYPAATAYPKDTYISELAVIIGDTYQEARQLAAAAGYTGWITTFVNATDQFRTTVGTSAEVNSSNNPIIAWKTTTNPAEAIRDIRATEQVEWAATQSFNGCTYTAAANNSNSHGDCNEGTQGAAYNGAVSNHPVYIYYTKDQKAGAPITDLFAFKTFDNTLGSVDLTKPFKLVTNMRENNDKSSPVVSWADGTSVWRYASNLNAYVTNGTRLFLGFSYALPAASSVDNTPHFNVPEAVYLTPGGTSFQYVLDQTMASDGGVSVNGGFKTLIPTNMVNPATFFTGFANASGVSASYGTVKATSTSNDAYSNPSHNDNSTKVAVTAGHTYTISFDYTVNTAASLEVMLFYYTSATANWDGSTSDRPVQSFPAGSGTYSYTFTARSGFSHVSFRLGIKTNGVTATFSDIRMYDNGAVTASGNVNFYCPTATNVTITQSQNCVVTADSNGAANRYDAQLKGGIQSNTGSNVIEWTATYTDTTDNQQKTAKAYTYIYAPCTKTLGAACITDSTPMTSAIYTRYSSCIALIYGITGVTKNCYGNAIYVGSGQFIDDKNYDSYGVYKTYPIQNVNYSLPSFKKGDERNNLLVTNTGDKNGQDGVTVGYDEARVECQTVGGYGYVNFDSSRQHTYADLPNFNVGVDFLNCNSTNSTDGAEKNASYYIISGNPAASNNLVKSVRYKSSKNTTSEIVRIGKNSDSVAADNLLSAQNLVNGHTVISYGYWTSQNNTGSGSRRHSYVA